MGEGYTTIKSILRVRPPHTEKGLRVRNNTVYIDKNSQEELSFLFDAAYTSRSTQEEIYREVEPYLDNIARGINTTILAYGATGSGKTYTMCGTAESPGIIPRIAGDLFGRYSETLSILFNVRIEMSYIEIYNEKVYDLLAEEAVSLPVREDASGRVVVQGVLEEKIGGEKEFRELFLKGGQRRKQGKTLLNRESSRSHAIVTLYVTLSTESSIVRTKINLVDLAGSENNKRTGNEGVRMVESANINRSLFALTSVMESLAKGSARVPYRESKLTRILQDSLGGLSDCAIIVNITGCSSGETLSTLGFSGKSRQVKLKPVKEKEAGSWRKIAEKREVINKDKIREINSKREKADILQKKSKGIINRRESGSKKKEKENLTLPQILEIVNSGDFLKIKKLPLVGDQRADKIIAYSRSKRITEISELVEAGVPAKAVEKILGSLC